MPLIAGRQVGPIGFGLMGLTWRETPPPLEQAIETMRASLKNGANFWNGGEFYGATEYNSLVVIEKYLEKYPEDAEKIVLSIKGGANPETHRIDASEKNTRRTMDDCNTQLKGRLTMHLFEYARRDPQVPLEVGFNVLNKEYVTTGKLGGISLSEVRAETIHEAVKLTKIEAVECEVSLFSTDVLTNGIAEACHKYGIPLIAYSPIGRGMLTGHIKKFEDLPEDSMMRKYPRFQPGNFEINLKLVEQVEEMAEKKSCTPAQLAINWIRTLSERPGMPVIIPIPGATTAVRVEENCKIVDITDAEMDQIKETLSKFTTAGERYPDSVPVNT